MEYQSISRENLQCFATLLGSILGTLAFLWNFCTWLKGRKDSIYDSGDSVVRDYLRMQIDHPEFRDPARIIKLHEEDKPKQTEAWFKYDAYCVMMWNGIETLYHKHGRKIMRAAYRSALLQMIERHRVWIADNEKDGGSNDAIEYLRRRRVLRGLDVAPKYKKT